MYYEYVRVPTYSSTNYFVREVREFQVTNGRKRSSARTEYLPHTPRLSPTYEHHNGDFGVRRLRRAKFSHFATFAKSKKCITILDINDQKHQSSDPTLWV